MKRFIAEKTISADFFYSGGDRDQGSQIFAIQNNHSMYVTLQMYLCQEFLKRNMFYFQSYHETRPQPSDTVLVTMVGSEERRGGKEG